MTSLLSAPEPDTTAASRIAPPQRRLRAPWQRAYVTALLAGDALAVVAATLAAQSLGFDGLGAGSDEYRRILNGALRFLAAVAILSMALKLDLARAMVAMAIPLATIFTLLNHFCARRWLHRRRAGGQCMNRVLVVGLEHQVADLVRHFRRASHAGMAVVGACVPGGGPTILAVDTDEIPVLGGPDDVVVAMRASRADTVALADHATLHGGALRRLGWDLEGTGVDLLVVPSLVDVAGPRISVRPVAGLPLLHVEEPELRGGARVVKHRPQRTKAARPRRHWSSRGTQLLTSADDIQSCTWTCSTSCRRPPPDCCGWPGTRPG